MLNCLIKMENASIVEQGELLISRSSIFVPKKNEWVMSDPKIQTQINEVQNFHRRKNLKRSLPLGESRSNEKKAAREDGRSTVTARLFADEEEE